MKQVDDQWMTDNEAVRYASVQARRTADHRELHPDGSQQGRDPRRMSAAELEACGLARQSRGDAIKAKCLDCMNHLHAEVRRCAAIECTLWPFRLGGADPWRAPMPDERRAALSQRAVSRGLGKQPPLVGDA